MGVLKSECLSFKESIVHLVGVVLKSEQLEGRRVPKYEWLDVERESLLSGWSCFYSVLKRFLV